MVGLANEGWAGHYANGWVVSNRSAQGCLLIGYPVLVLFDDAGKPLTQPVVYKVDDTYQEHGPQTVTLAPAAKATVILTGGNAPDCHFEDGDVRLVPSSTAVTRARADAVPLYFPPAGVSGIGKIEVCPEPISVSPWQPGDVADNVGAPERTISPSS